MKQALVEQGMYRGQENSHLEWPDHTLLLYVPCMTLTVLVRPSALISLGQVCRDTATRHHKYNTDGGRSKLLTGSMQRESTAAVPCPVIRKVRPPPVFTNPGPPPREGEGFSSKRNILVA